MRENNTLRNWDVESFWELFDPEVSICLRFWIVAVDYDNDSLSLLLNRWPYSLIFRVTLINEI